MKLAFVYLLITLFIRQTISTCSNYSLSTLDQAYNGDFQQPNLGASNYLVGAGNLAGWTSTSNQIGKGTWYNSRWGATQVVELATSNQNTIYNKSFTLINGKQYQFKIQCAAKDGYSLATSGFKVLWNDALEIDGSNPSDYQIHSFSKVFVANGVNNKLTLMATGTIDSHGSTCDNVQLHQILGTYNRIQVNGSCLCEPGFFDVPPTQKCQACSTVDPQCLICQNSTNASMLYQFTCTQCNWGYYSTGSTCLPCSSIISFCINCTMDGLTCTSCQTIPLVSLSSGQCVCDPGYYQNSGSCQSCTVFETICLLCQQNGTQTICTSCQPIAFTSISGGHCVCDPGYYESGGSCLTCTSFETLCQFCEFNGTQVVCTACQPVSYTSIVDGHCVCDPGYYEDLGICKTCSSFEVLCLKCIMNGTQETCTQCQSGFYPSISSCLSCNYIHYACLNCSGTGVCFQCDLNGNWELFNNSCRCPVSHFQNLTLSTCQPCSNINIQCIDCWSNVTLSLCYQCLPGFYPIANSCIPCDNPLFGCQLCNINGSVCTQCDTAANWELINNTCSCIQGFYQNQTSNTCMACSLLDTRCLICQYGLLSTYECTSCDWGYFPINDTCVPCNTSLEGCLNCTMDGLVCYGCDQFNDYFTSLINTNNCTRCDLFECLNCSSLDTCELCNQANKFYLNITSQLCEACSLQGCIDCLSLYECVQCDSVSNYLLNNVTNLCHVCTLEGCIRCSSNQTCDMCGNGYKAFPNADLKCDKIYGCSDLIDGLTGGLVNPSVPAVEYSLQDCETAKNYQKLADTVFYTSYALLFLSLISGKIVGLELFGILQLSYLNLADHQFVNLYLSPYLGWRFTNGFNFEPKHTNSSQNIKNQRLLASFSNRILAIEGKNIVTESLNVVPSRVVAIGYSHSFLENVNFMLIIIVAEFFISLVLVLMSKKIKCLQRIAQMLFKQVFLTLFLFNCLNISFSAGLHFKYANQTNTESYTLSTACAIFALIFCFVALLSLQILNGEQFGQFKEKFKKNWLTRAYISISIIYRIALGFYMAYGNDQNYQSLLILAMSLAYIMYNIINLPFKDAYQNYRANVCHCTQLLILIVTNFYTAMKVNEPIEVKGRNYTPAKIQMGMIIFCLLVSAICLFYELYLFLKRKCKKESTSSRKVISENSNAKICQTEQNDKLYQENE